MLFDEFGDLAEVGVFGGFQQFEQCHFGCAYVRPNSLHLIQCEGLIRFCA